MSRSASCTIPGAITEFNKQDFTDLGAGYGSTLFTYTLTNDQDGTPIVGAEVWATTDVFGVDIVARGITDAFGVVRLFLDPGTYYIWRQLSGWTFQNPDTEIVT